MLRLTRMPTTPRLQSLASLMRAYLAGDERALARLFRALAPRLRPRLSAHVVDASRIDDLLQLTFVKAHQYRERFQWGEGDPDRAVLRWYLLVARNVSIDDLRHRARARRRLEQIQLDGLTHAHLAFVGSSDQGDAEAELVDDERRAATVARVREAVASLPRAQREIIEMHKLRGLSTVELAEQLHVRPGTLRVRAHRAYRRLAELLAPPAVAAAA
jgi:RNA polymerase sigma-70 factor (ECF subfamily)